MLEVQWATLILYIKIMGWIPKLVQRIFVISSVWAWPNNWDANFIRFCCLTFGIKRVFGHVIMQDKQ